MDILTIGEALIDFKQSQNLKFEGFEGGSPLNVAVAAARLGADVGFAGQISTDLFGRVITQHIADNKIDTSYLLEHDSPTTLAFVAEINNDAHFSFINNGAADTLYNPQPRPEFPKELQFLMFGSISLLTEPTASSIEDIVASHQASTTIVFDPNVRPALITNKEEYLTRLHKWLELADIVKLSRQDLEWLYPKKYFKNVALDWLQLNPAAIIITDGEKGANLYRKNQELISSKVYKVDVLDTVGAGDTFTAALMVSLLNKDINNISNLQWQESLDFAALAAALNCTKAGANPPSLKSIENYQKS